MTRSSILEYADAVRGRYLSAPKKTKMRILNEFVANTGLHRKAAIRLNRRRTQKKDAYKEGWLKLKASSPYQEGLKQRYQVERKSAEARKWQGFKRCRYTGNLRHAIQSYSPSWCLTLKGW